MVAGGFESYMVGNWEHHLGSDWGSLGNHAEKGAGMTADPAGSSVVEDKIVAGLEIEGTSLIRLVMGIAADFAAYFG